jgi:uncharacterized membrane protein
MRDRIRFQLNRIGERLWVRPLAVCILSIIGVFLAKTTDNTQIGQLVPDITTNSIETLLSTNASSMLVIATFAVASMLSAYTSASGTATPRSFSLVISDDVSQNALSTFIGAFIFSIVALIAVQNSFYNTAGRFTIFVLTVLVFVIVVLTFVRWTDNIARLGRLGTTVDKVETATAAALQKRRETPTFGGVPTKSPDTGGQAVYADSIGYLQRIDVDILQKTAENSDTQIAVACLPGTFTAPGQALAYVTTDSGESFELDTSEIKNAFLIGDDRLFDDDPRFGLIVLSEIASRALSPAVNDPGTAIDIIGTFVRLFAHWGESVQANDDETVTYDRVTVPEISLHDMFDDAFPAIARDGAGTIEVVVRLQKALQSLGSLGNHEMRANAVRHSRLSLARAEAALALPEERALVRQLSQFAHSDSQS